MKLGVVVEKGKRRAWGSVVRVFRHKPVYPLLYRSWWHSRSIRSTAETSVLPYMSAVPNPGAGIGHQMANWIAGFWFAREFGLPYAHIPFLSREWEQLLGFGAGEVRVEDLVRTQGYRKVRLPLFEEFNPAELERTRKIIASYRGRKVVFVLEQDQFYRDQFGIMDDIQKKFYQAASKRSDQFKFSDMHYNIAIHVRRGDIVAGQLNGDPNLQMRWQDTTYFEKVLFAVLETCKTTKPIKIYLFSQGDRTEFANFKKLGDVELCLEMGARESFLHMAYADLLITSKSSFSYKPALLSRGIKVCPRNFWHGYPEAADWVLAEEDGSLSSLSVTKLQRA